MKNRLRITLHLFISMNASICMGQNSLNEEILGKWKWEKNNSSNDFTLKIKKTKSGVYYAKHCYILNNGSKMDCALEKGDTTFKILNFENNTTIVQFKSFVLNQKGKIKITYKKPLLIIEVLEEPKGEFYFPEKLTLIKELGM
jgi:hypothetical protein